MDYFHQEVGFLALDLWGKLLYEIILLEVQRGTEDYLLEIQIQDGSNSLGFDKVQQKGLYLRNYFLHD